MSGFEIGAVHVPNCTALGPMAGVTDLPFRLLCKEQGAGLLYTEMVSAKAILYRNRNTGKLLAVDRSEHPIAVQLFGSEPEVVAEAASMIEDDSFDLFDLNMGCPVPKVVGNGEGSALMKEPELAARIVRTLAARVSKPVTVKIRKGFDDAHVNAPEFAKRMEDAGAAAIAVHARTREQYYAGKADWEIIRAVKQAVSVPVIGNGDVNSAESALRMRMETGCDAVMAARAARGNPWLFRELSAAMERAEDAKLFQNRMYENRQIAADEDSQEDVLTGILENLPQRPSVETVCDTMLRHAEMEVALKQEYIAIREMRGHAAWYTKGIRNAAGFRRKVNEVESLNELKELVELLRQRAEWRDL